MMRFGVAAAALAWASGAAAGQETAPPIRALILTGENNHNWRYTSRVHEETLESSGRFDVDIADDAAAALSDAAKLGGYQVLVLDYNGKPWGELAQSNFVKAVEGGAGLVVIHAANNAFAGWGPYESMVGLLWREGTGHGEFHTFDVEYVSKAHPVTRGMADMKAHPDELYHDLKNPQGAAFEVLAEAFSDTKTGGSGKREPVAIAMKHRQGRVFHTPLGHVWEGREDQKRSISDPQFRVLLCRGAEWAATGQVTIGAEFRDARAHNTLSEQEKRDGWVLLFDGTGTDQFRGFKQEGFPAEGWVVEDGAIRHVAGKGGGDIMTREQYANYEFACEWKVAPKGNSGIIYRCTEDGGATYVTGPEMQVLDNAGHADGHNGKTSAGALYGLIASAHDVVRPAGEWNSVRLVVNGDHVEHWANGWKILEYELNSPQWDALVNDSKFKDWKDFGRKPKGHIALQDHGDDVWYRNIRVKPLP
jgi:type 1 glutamine amidotransferase